MTVLKPTNIDRSIFKSLIQLTRSFIHRNLIPSKERYLSLVKSKNGKGIIYHISNAHSAALVTYEFAHEDGQGSILLTLYDLRELYNNLEKLILERAALGQLSQVELLCKQRKNTQFGLYTHRLQISRVKNTQTLAWLINLNFQKSDSYGSGTGVEVIKSVLLKLLNRSYSHHDYKDILDAIIQENWLDLIHKEAKKAYKNFPTHRLQCIFCRYHNFSTSSDSSTHPNESIHNKEQRIYF